LGKQERQLVSELLDALRHQAQTTTEFVARLSGQVINNVLEVATLVIPAEGFITRSYSAAAGCIDVSNLGVAANLMTVVSAGPGGNAPPSGTGVYVLAGATRRTIALASHEFTIWGTAGDKVAFQVFTSGIDPSTT
jgi:hypothetical protein